MTQEQLIYKNMKRKGNIWKSHGKFGISYSALYCAIKDAGYEDRETVQRIIKRMVNKGYIRHSKDVYGRSDWAWNGNYIIEKWVN